MKFHMSLKNFKLFKIPFFEKLSAAELFVDTKNVPQEFAVDKFSRKRNFKKLEIENCQVTYELYLYILKILETIFNYNKKRKIL